MEVYTSSYNWPSTGSGSAFWKDPVATVASLPPTGNTAGDVRLALDTDNIYVWTGSSWISVASPGGGSVVSVTASAPVASSGGTSPNISITQSGTSTNGYLSSTDWNTFNSKQATLTFGNLTDAGTDGISVTGGTGAIIGSGAAIAQHVADSTHNGYLSSTDWSTFNSKQDTITIGSLTDGGTDGIVVSGGTNAVLGSGTSIAQHVADSTHNGYLSSTDWSTFNGKQSTLTFGNLTDVGTDGIVVTNGTGSVIGSGTSLAQHVADSTHNGYLSSADWSIFNGKQAAGNYITDLTGDLTASGPGSAVGTLATVNSNVGSFGSSTAIPSFTVNGKGLITAASTNVVIAPAGTLTGTTLASNVVNSSLTSLGSSAAVVTTTGGVIGTVRTITANLTLDTTTTDYVVLCNNSGAINVTLPAPVSGRIFIIKDIKGTANTNNITIVRNGSEQIDGLAASYIMSTNFGSISITSDGTNWWII